MFGFFTSKDTPLPPATLADLNNLLGAKALEPEQLSLSSDKDKLPAGDEVVDTLIQLDIDNLKKHITESKLDSIERVPLSEPQLRTNIFLTQETLTELLRGLPKKHPANPDYEVKVPKTKTFKSLLEKTSIFKETSFRLSQVLGYFESDDGQHYDSTPSKKALSKEHQIKLKKYIHKKLWTALEELILLERQPKRNKYDNTIKLAKLKLQESGLGNKKTMYELFAFERRKDFHFQACKTGWFKLIALLTRSKEEAEIVELKKATHERLKNRIDDEVKEEDDASNNITSEAEQNFLSITRLVKTADDLNTLLELCPAENIDQDPLAIKLTQALFDARLFKTLTTKLKNYEKPNPFDYPKFYFRPIYDVLSIWQKLPKSETDGRRKLFKNAFIQAGKNLLQNGLKSLCEIDQRTNELPESSRNEKIFFNFLTIMPSAYLAKIATTPEDANTIATRLANFYNEKVNYFMVRGSLKPILVKFAKLAKLAEQPSEDSKALIDRYLSFVKRLVDFKAEYSNALNELKTNPPRAIIKALGFNSTDTDTLKKLFQKALPTPSSIMPRYK